MSSLLQLQDGFATCFCIVKSSLLSQGGFLTHNSFIRGFLSCHALNFVVTFVCVANSALSLSSTSDHRRRCYCFISRREYVTTEFVHDCKTLSSIFLDT